MSKVPLHQAVRPFLRLGGTADLGGLRYARKRERSSVALFW